MDSPSAGGDQPQPEAERELKLRSSDLASRGFKEETVVLDLRSSTYLATNPAGSTLWRLLERGATRSQLIAALLAEFEVEEREAAADVDAFIGDCARRGLLSS